MQKIRTFLWFDGDVEEAMKLYTSIFKNSKMGDLMRGPDGKVTGGTFTLEGVEFMGLNGGPQFKFTEAISLMINCKDQKEVDYYWEKLLAGGGKESACGWLKDKYGLSWQVTPTILMKMIADKNRKKAQRAFNAMMQMVKIDIRKLKEAYDG